MADCEETLRELQTFLDGELPREELEHVRHHIDGCMDCLQVYDFYAELRTVIRARTDGKFPTSPVDGIPIADLGGAPGSSGNIVHGNAINGTTYSYAAFAIDSAENPADRATVTATPSGVTPPAPPLNLSVN